MLFPINCSTLARFHLFIWLRPSRKRALPEVIALDRRRKRSKRYSSVGGNRLKWVGRQLVTLVRVSLSHTHIQTTSLRSPMIVIQSNVRSTVIPSTRWRPAQFGKHLFSEFNIAMSLLYSSAGKLFVIPRAFPQVCYLWLLLCVRNGAPCSHVFAAPQWGNDPQAGRVTNAVMPF